MQVHVVRGGLCRQAVPGLPGGLYGAGGLDAGRASAREEVLREDILVVCGDGSWDVTREREGMSGIRIWLAGGGGGWEGGWHVDAAVSCRVV